MPEVTAPSREDGGCLCTLACADGAVKQVLIPSAVDGSMSVVDSCELVASNAESDYQAALAVDWQRQPDALIAVTRSDRAISLLAGCGDSSGCLREMTTYEAAHEFEPWCVQWDRVDPQVLSIVLCSSSLCS